MTAVLRVMGFGRERCFHKHHRVLSHARWSVLAAGRLLLGELLAALAPTGPVVMGLDDTIERWYAKRRPTFSDALALVRSRLWRHRSFSGSVQSTHAVKIPTVLLEQLTEALCYAA